jgi:ABC transport system ATP-binding/permease protein
MDSHPDLAIEVRWPGGRTERHPIGQTALSIGRNPSNDLPLNYPAVSGRHLQLARVGGLLELVDLRSTNGTQVNGRFIEPGVPREIRPGDVVRIGDPTGNSIAFTVVSGDTGLPSRTDRTGVKLSEGAVVIGRDPACTLRLDHPAVSRRHAEIVPLNGGHAIRDLMSANGSYVNDQRVVDLRPLAAGDVVRIGPFRLGYDPQFGRMSTTTRRGYRLDAIDLGVAVRGGRKILDRISLTVDAGEFVAFVGGSGAGKSTLMKAMNGYNRATHGQILLDGQELYPVLDAYRSQMGFVPQDDIIHRILPVQLALWHAARLRLPDATRDEIDARVRDAIAAVDLTAHAAKPVSVLSGGQRKRVSIAAELLAQPVLLFLDEPTSGLDPGLEKKMMYDLGRLADEGRTIILVTHATGNIEQCHLVAFLAQGRLAYYGPPRSAIAFFNAQDFSDIYLKLAAEVQPGDERTVPVELRPAVAALRAEGDTAAATTTGALWAEHFRRSADYRAYVQDRQKSVPQPGAESAAVPPARSRDSAFRQIRVLARREWDLIRHDVRTLLMILLVPPLIAGLFGVFSGRTDLVGLQMETEQIRSELKTELRGALKDTKASYVPVPDAARVLTMLCLALTQMGTFAGVYQIVKERAIYKRERSINLRVIPYIVSKAIVLGGLAFLQVITALLAFSFFVDIGVTPILRVLPSGATELFITLYLAQFASIMFGLLISATVPNEDVVVYVVLAQMFTQIVLAGTYFHLPDQPVTRLAIANWAVEATGSTAGMKELNETSQACQVVEIPGGRSTQIVCNDSPLSDYDVGLNYTHTPGHLFYLWGGLLAHAACWGALAMIVQARKRLE